VEIRSAALINCELSASFWSPITLGKRVLNIHQTGGWVGSKAGKNLVTAKTYNHSYAGNWSSEIQHVNIHFSAQIIHTVRKQT